MSSKKKLSYSKILLKLSGEALQGSQGYGIDNITLERIAKEINEVSKLPGLGRRSAQRIALYLLKNKEKGTFLFKP